MVNSINISILDSVELMLDWFKFEKRYESETHKYDQKLFDQLVLLDSFLCTVDSIIMCLISVESFNYDKIITELSIYIYRFRNSFKSHGT